MDSMNSPGETNGATGEGKPGFARVFDRSVKPGGVRLKQVGRRWKKQFLFGRPLVGL